MSPTHLLYSVSRPHAFTQHFSAIIPKEKKRFLKVSTTRYTFFLQRIKKLPGKMYNAPLIYLTESGLTVGFGLVHLSQMNKLSLIISVIILKTFFFSAYSLQISLVP